MRDETLELEDGPHGLPTFRPVRCRKDGLQGLYGEDGQHGEHGHHDEHGQHSRPSQLSLSSQPNQSNQPSAPFRSGNNDDAVEETPNPHIHTQQTTFALAMSVYISRITAVGQEMRSFISDGYSESDRSGDMDARMELER